MKEKNRFQYLIPCLFIVLVLCIQQQQIQISFFLAGILLLSLFFFSEKNRLVLWISIAYLAGHLFYMYANKFVDLADLSLPAKILLNRLLLICILMPISIIYFSFIKEKPVTIIHSRPFSMTHKIDPKLVTLLLSLPMLIILLNRPFSTPLLYGLLFCLLHAALHELIWRGILLNALKIRRHERSLYLHLELALASPRVHSVFNCTPVSFFAFLAVSSPGLHLKQGV